MNSNFYKLLLVLLCTGLSFGQTESAQPEGKRIKNIIVVGNEKTRDIVILREMKTKIGDIYDPEKLEEDRNRILNLDLFNRVEMQPMEAEDGIILLVIVTERWYIFPYPILFINERDWSKVSYGFGLFHSNVRGMNNILNGALWFGYNPGVHLIYSNPWIGGRHHFYYRLEAFSYKVRSKSLRFAERFDQLHRNASVSFGKRWGYHTYASMTGGFRLVSVPAKYAPSMLSGTETDQYPSLGLAFRYDTRDLYEYPLSGWRIDLYATQNGFTAPIHYLRYGFDIRTYVPVSSAISLAVRTAVDLSVNPVPFYGKMFLGYSERIRGHFNQRLEGDNRALASLELRFPILPLRYVDLGRLFAFMGPYARDLPFGLSAGLFVDFGAVWNQEVPLRSSDFLQGYGMGLHFRVPYARVLRLELAFDEIGNREIIFDVGVWF